jgi:RalA-binding protein 1
MKEPLGPLVKQQLPEANYHLLLTLIGHLRLIVEYAEFNKMTLRNIAIIFAPTLSIPSGLFNLLMTEYESSFHLTVQPTTSADRFKQNYLKRKKNKSYFQ